MPGLDHVLRGIEPGDNIVWEVDSIEEYQELVVPYAAAARTTGRRLIYFRFAPYPPLLDETEGAEVRPVDCAAGFQRFVRHIHRVIEEAGPGAQYVFDCLFAPRRPMDFRPEPGELLRAHLPASPGSGDSDLLRHLPRPALGLRTRADPPDHAVHARCVPARPAALRPAGEGPAPRSREVMNTIHVRQGDVFLPVRDSAVLAQILSRTQWPRLQSDSRAGHWRRLFHEAAQVEQECREERCAPGRREAVLRRIRRALRVHRSGISPLVERFLQLEDFLAVRDRMIGIGSVGGKTLGMLVARAILRERDRRSPGGWRRTTRSSSAPRCLSHFSSETACGGASSRRRGSRPPRR